MEKDFSSPCIEKNCSWCCNPVKVNRWTDIPKDKKGRDIWIKRDEIWIPESHPETVKLEIYNCLHYNQETGLCKEYDDRPDICRNTHCVKPSNDCSIDKQHKNFTSDKFFKISTNKKG